MKRRAFLKRGLAGGALLAIAGAGLSLIPSKRIATATAPLLVLDDTAFQAMAAISARVLPEDADPSTIAMGVDRALVYAPLEAQHDLVQVLHLFESALVGLLLDGRPHPFTRLDAEAQDRALFAFRDSRIALRRGAYQALRKLALSVYYADARSWPKMHYGGPPSPNFLLDDSEAGTPKWIAEHGGETG